MRKYTLFCVCIRALSLEHMAIKDDYVSHKGREGKIENVDVPCVVLFLNILTSMRIFVHMLPYQPVHIR